MMKSFPFEHSNILLTGGTGEIGHEFLVVLSKRPVGKIFVPGSNEKRLNQIKADFPNLSIEIFCCDLTKEESFNSLIDFIQEKIGADGKLDLVIFGAGMLGIDGKESFPRWDNALLTMALNVLSPAFCFKRLLDLNLLSKGTCVMALSSIAGHLSYADSENISIYAASKAALHRVVMNWAKDHPEMTIFELALGAVQTKMLDTCRPPNMPEKEWQEALMEDIPIKEIGQPQIVAETIISLLDTPGHRLFHGDTVHLSGGERL